MNGWHFLLTNILPSFCWVQSPHTEGEKEAYCVFTWSDYNHHIYVFRYIIYKPIFVFEQMFSYNSIYQKNSNFLLTVNDRLSPRGLICQNDYLGSIFKVWFVNIFAYSVSRCLSISHNWQKLHVLVFRVVLGVYKH